MRRIVGQNIWSHVRYIPFVDLDSMNIRIFILNIVLFSPLGFLVQFVGKSKKTFGKTLLVGLAVSAGIECAQFILAFVQGFTFRFVEATAHTDCTHVSSTTDDETTGSK
jgi:glycopeptide antibiotics resistance protein